MQWRAWLYGLPPPRAPRKCRAYPRARSKRRDSAGSHGTLAPSHVQLPYWRSARVPRSYAIIYQ
nr:MAG TPA: hypothetical protein [Caudoviricetes sp.]